MKFDLSKIELSNNDIKRGLTLPKKPSKELAEFIGILIGDGYLYKRKYTIGIVGNPKTDKEYFDKIQNLIKKLFNVAFNVKIRQRGLRLTLKSKGLFSYLTGCLSLEYGKRKGPNIKIPQLFIKDSKLITSLIRGIFDTDGTIFTSDKKGSKDYPCIELTTTSINLAKQVKDVLIDLGFKVAGIRKYRYKHSELTSNKVSLYGNKNSSLWYKKVGFSNPNKKYRLLKIKKWDLRNLNPRVKITHHKLDDSPTSSA